jgi:BirA family biotin operon repressor/biotin-[acetyl-CoA-carboxylase] ligase
MTLIKLHSTSSTNDYLKELSKKELLENFTTVITQKQENGKGQMGEKWETEEGKNLITSIFVKNIITNPEEIFHLNVATSVAVFETLQALNIPNIAIKWANDIMADSKKVCGILIENSFKPNGKIESIIGIGLNVNQTHFNNLPKASSLQNITNHTFDIELILSLILQKLKYNCTLILDNNTNLLWEKLHQNLFKINVPMAFQDCNQQKFMGIIKGVNQSGKLEVQLIDDSIKTFSVKEIQLLF